MPRKPEKPLSLRWNLYVNEDDKLNYLLALAKCGKQQCQSAGVRAFMHLYAQDETVRNKVNDIIDNYIVYKDNGSISKL